MKLSKLALIVIFLIGCFSLYSQDTIVLSPKDSLVQSSWMVGVGWNFIDDSGDAFNDFTTIRDQWNGVAFPSRINIGKYFKNGLGIEAIASYNRYKEGNIIDGVILPEFKDYFSIDSRLSYDLNKLVGHTAWFDPYVGVGIGYADANDVPRGTYNAVIGFRTWFSDRWGLDLSSSGKWSFGNEASNHIQHAVGVVYQFNIEKGLTKKGEEKVTMLKNMQEKAQRVQDSLSYIKLVEEQEAAAALAERLAKEREEALVAAQEIENRSLDAKSKLQIALNDLGSVYFTFNSSYLNTDTKALLDDVAALMIDYPSYNFQINGHADSRGTDHYNLWLSERRAKRTVEYLIAQGVGPNQLAYNSYGESQLVNECSDGVYCSEEKHALNRKTNILVLVKKNLISINEITNSPTRKL
jgi:outer membrane protein OmpA-like peptidoglycan-associated protein